MFCCPNCSSEYKAFRYTCDKCGNVLFVDYENKKWEPKGMGVWRYQSMIPVYKSISLNEGATPLIRRKDVKDEVFMKIEGDNPTGSFKDRGTTVVVSNACNRGYKNICTASTGNMGASIAAYSAYANIKAKIFIPNDVTDEKVAQIKAYGAELVKVKGTFKEAVKMSLQEIDKKRTYLGSTGINPYYLEGHKTIAFELFEQMGVPDKIVVPMGTGGLLTGIYKGFLELKELGVIKHLPEMHGVQAKNCSPIATAWEKGSEITEPKKHPNSIASAIMVKTPYNGYTAITSISLSNGSAIRVSDPEIISAMKELGKEGIFAEPAAAASLAGLKKIDYLDDDRVALIISGNGLKDATAMIKKKR